MRVDKAQHSYYCGVNRSVVFTSKRLHNEAQGRASRTLGRLFPNVALVVFDFIFRKQPTEFILICISFMMLVLIGDVGFDRIEMARANRKRPVPLLPIERGENGRFLLDSLRRIAFHLANEVGNRNRFPLPAENMHMILYAADNQRR